MKRRSIIKTISSALAGLCFWRKTTVVQAVPSPERTFEDKFEEGKLLYAHIIAEDTCNGQLTHPQYGGDAHKVLEAWEQLSKGAPTTERKLHEREKAYLIPHDKDSDDVIAWNEWAENRNAIVQREIDVLKFDIQNDGSDLWGRTVKERLTAVMSHYDRSFPHPSIPKTWRWMCFTIQHPSQYLFVPVLKMGDKSLSKIIYTRTTPTDGEGWTQVSLTEVIK